MGLLKYALIALVIAGIAAVFGFGGVAEGFAEIAKVLFYIFVAIFAVIGLIAAVTFKKVT